MHEIEIEIDEEGNIISEIHNIKGKACEVIEKLIAEELGTVKSSKPTKEYYQQPVRQRQVTRR